jgi:peptidoglycan hydrolase-like protein with peptidoglycan-binding domain
LKGAIVAETRGLFGDLFGKKDKDKPKEAAKPSAADLAKEKNKVEADAASKKAADALAKAKADEAARKAALPKLTVDGNWGAATTAAIQKVLGTKVGGAWINNTDAKALQKKLGVTADGLFGANSNKALQKYLKVTADGVFGPNSVKALQKALNAGTFFPAPQPKAAASAPKAGI